LGGYSLGHSKYKLLELQAAKEMLAELYGIEIWGMKGLI
jgi:hypothetical protein